jgi:hypothetical protein
MLRYTGYMTVDIYGLDLIPTGNLNFRITMEITRAKITLIHKQHLNSDVLIKKNKRNNSE